MNSDNWPFKIDEVSDFAYVENFLTEEECKEIIKIGNNKEQKDAVIIGNNKQKVSKVIRKSKVCWLGTQDIPNIYRRLTDSIMHLNDKYFKFNLFGFSEAMQFTVYDGKGTKYRKHVDRAYGIKVRKLSITIELSDPNKRVGGDLKLITSDDNWSKSSVNTLPKKRGTLIAFPSWTLHEVEPIVEGTRYSLVAWITGENFK
jgi:PKHD-type hydroxylase